MYIDMDKVNPLINYMVINGNVRLSFGKQCIIIFSSHSSFRDVLSGVLIESIIKIMLFLVYINYFPNIIKY